MDVLAIIPGVYGVVCTDAWAVRTGVRLSSLEREDEPIETWFVGRVEESEEDK